METKKSIAPQSQPLMAKATRRAYKQPKLTKHGNVKNITLGTGSIADDEGATSRLI